MRKFLFLILTLLSGILFLKAEEYQSMQFLTVSGYEYLIPLEGLEIVYTDESLVATQGWRKLELPKSELKSMQFSSQQAAVGQIYVDRNNPVEVFDTNGISHGIFTSSEDINAGLADGIYILKHKDGSTRKITLKR